MIPSAYRLDEVVARLIERLEAARPSYVDAESAQVAFRRAAEEHVQAAVDEYRSLLPGDRAVDRQAELLRREVIETFLPRYGRLAAARGAVEDDHHGFGPLGTGPGRMVLVGLALFLVYALGRYAGSPWAWPGLVAVLSLPLWPDVAAWAGRRSHLRALQAVVDDMQRIQEQATAYAPADPAPEAPVRPRGREGEWRG